MNTRKPVNKSRSAAQFKATTRTVKALNMPMRGGFRL